MDQPPGSSPLLSERRLASARRLALLTARVEALKAHAAVESATERRARTLQPLQGQPPYDLIEVDALRDQLDALAAQRAALGLAVKSLDAEVEGGVQARAAADANLRLRRQQSARVRDGDDVAQMRAEVELAELQAQVAELEVVQADAARRRARERLAALSEPIAQFEREITRVRGQQRLDEAGLAKVLKDVAAERQRISAERAKLTEQLARRETEMAAPDAARAHEVEIGFRTIAALRELAALERGKEGLWRMRQEALATTDDIARKRAMAATLGRLIEEVLVQQRSAAEHGELLRSELRAQQALVRGLPADDPARSGEQRVLEALQTQLGVLERLHESFHRGAVLLTRSRTDLGLTDRPESASGWLEHVQAVLGEGFARVWNYELFSATETTTVDGRVVTVDHSVTVGKSLGVLMLFGLGYWAAGRLSRTLIALMARRLHLSSHLARALRGWVKAILLLVVVLLVLRVARIPLTAFAFLGGALAIGVGFGAQNVIKNLISGVIILFERKIRVGDIISVGGMSGTVIDVDLRATTVRGFDGIDAIVPNSTLLENQISN